MPLEHRQIQELVESVRRTAGPEMVSSRSSAEADARALLDQSAGRMTEDEALLLGRLFNTGTWHGTMKYSRFAPAFHGATMKKLISDLDLFNRWTRELWSADEEVALNALDTIARDRAALPGAGRSYPSMLLYLRDPQRYIVWMKATVKGLRTLTAGSSTYSRDEGRRGFERFCEAVGDLRTRFGLAPQETDAVLWAAAKREASPRSTRAQPPPPPDQPPTLRALADETSITVDELETWVDLLGKTGKRQALFYGPPGTGKTFVAERLALYLAGSAERVTTVQFHPSYSYEDFIEGLRPDPSSDGIRYVVRPGVFSEFCERARAVPEATFVFVVDEINRADLGSVLGELMLLLEYRGKTVPLPYSKRTFSVPPNVILLATMNTADRSLAVVDFALRRRFHTIQVLPSRQVLQANLRGRDGADLALQMFDLVQRKVADDDSRPGHSYFLVEDLSVDGLFKVWTYELRPYLAEFWFEHPGRLDELDREVSGLLAEEA